MRTKRGKRRDIPRSSTFDSAKNRSVDEVGLGSTTHQSLRSSIHGTQAQIRCEYFPDNLGLEPHIRLSPTDFHVPTDLGQLKRSERLVVGLKGFLAKAGTDFADRLVFLRVTVIARQKECPIDICSFALAIVSPDDDKIEGIADASKIVLLDLMEERNRFSIKVSSAYVPSPPSTS